MAPEQIASLDGKGRGEEGLGEVTPVLYMIVSSHCHSVFPSFPFEESDALGHTAYKWIEGKKDILLLPKLKNEKTPPKKREKEKGKKKKDKNYLTLIMLQDKLWLHG